jgi:NADPH-dependent 2,4-dienoyl-CoA reductase/sulfur reductase-like enzyme
MRCSSLASAARSRLGLWCWQRLYVLTLAAGTTEPNPIHVSVAPCVQNVRYVDAWLQQARLVCHCSGHVPLGASAICSNHSASAKLSKHKRCAMSANVQQQTLVVMIPTQADTKLRMAPQPRVAIVGAGIAGSACAAHLARAGVAVTIADLGRAPGRRCACEGHQRCCVACMTLAKP